KSILAVTKNSSAGGFQTVYASPVTNSADGKGAPIKGEDKSWLPFGQPQADKLAMYGFAIASHLLYLQEGDRMVTLIFEATQNLPTNKYLFWSKPVVKLTGEMGWEDAKLESFARSATNAKQFVLICSLTPKAKGIVPFQAALHSDAFETPYPVLKVVFTSANGYNTAKEWSAIQLKKVNLQVHVAGLKKLVVRNDLSVLDTSKPFQPFGPNPYAGSACIIGSKEIFQKEGAGVTLNFEWDKVPQPEGIISHMSFHKNGDPVSSNIIDIRHDTFYDYDTYVLKTAVSQLQNGLWSNPQAGQNLFTSREMFGNDLVDHIKGCGDLNDLRNRHLFSSYPESSFTAAQDTEVSFTVQSSTEPDFTPTENFSTNTVNGYVRLELNRDTGYKDFVQRFTQLAAKQ
ncbi:MAG TPA: hypothetical protein VFL47_11720, partial [Flavisolibacter sp.]|nr:hypothetical protein [Flavisolibacter sp.]